MKRKLDSAASGEHSWPAKRARVVGFDSNSNRQLEPCDLAPLHHQRPLRRSTSAPPLSPGPPIPITPHNLRQLQRSLGLMGAPKSSSRSAASNDNKPKLGPAEKLRLYRIYSEEGFPFPPALEAHIKQLKQERSEPSPNAQLLAGSALGALSMGEQDGIDHLKTALLFLRADKGGTDLVRQCAKPNLSTLYLPPPTPGAPETSKVLEQPQPDHAVGYIPAKFARQARTTAPFTEEQEDVLSTLALTPEIHFPYFTAQWKSPAKGQTHEQGKFQGARDGATIVNYLDQFYRRLRPATEPTVLETCHHSVTIDLRSVVIWLHWRDGDKYYMEEIESGMLKKDRDAGELRRVLRNIEDWALGDRLRSIRELLDVQQRAQSMPASAPTFTSPLATVLGSSLASGLNSSSSGSRVSHSGSSDSYVAVSPTTLPPSSGDDAGTAMPPPKRLRPWE